MKELTAAFQSEVFRPIATLVVPGFFAIFTLSIAVWQRYPAVESLLEKHPSLGAATAVLLILTLGLMTENFGARLEQVFDVRLAALAKYRNHREEWFDYLRLAFVVEPVGHRYLRSIVLRLKFELGMTVACIPFAMGSLFLQTACHWRLTIFAVGLLGLVIFAMEAKSSNKTLSELRREMLKAYKAPKGEAMAGES